MIEIDIDLSGEEAAARKFALDTYANTNLSDEIAKLIEAREYISEVFAEAVYPIFDFLRDQCSHYQIVCNRWDCDCAVDDSPLEWHLATMASQYIELSETEYVVLEIEEAIRLHNESVEEKV